MFTIISLLFSLTIPITASISVGSLPYNFTLAALNLTLPNSNSTGAPLVLGQDGAISGAEFEVTSTYASYPYNDWPALALVNTSIRAFHADGSWDTNATQTTSGGFLGWLTTSQSAPDAATGYTAVGSQLEALTLAYNGQSGLWSLCPAQFGQTNVVFNVSADSSDELGIDPAKCYAVSLNILSVEA